MGEAKRRKREIADLKKNGPRVATPFADSPVLYAQDAGAWLIVNTEFGTAFTAVWQNPITPEGVMTSIRELARLALWAERSGVRDDICQNWFSHQQQALYDLVRERRQTPVVATLLSSNE